MKTYLHNDKMALPNWLAKLDMSLVQVSPGLLLDFANLSCSLSSAALCLQYYHLLEGEKTKQNPANIIRGKWRKETKDNLT